MRREQQLRIRTGPRVDWLVILADIKSRGVPMVSISRQTRIPAKTLYGWTTLDTEPRHADGEAIIALWCRVTGLDREQLPVSNACGWL